MTTKQSKSPLRTDAPRRAFTPKVGLLAIVLMLFAATAFSQKQAQFFKNIPLKRLFTILERDFNVHFSYDADLVADRKVDYFLLDRKSLQSSLVALLRDTGLGFDQYGSSVIIKRVPPEFYEKYYVKICGKVIDAKEGLPLERATVVVKNSSIGISTDSLGRFTLRGPFVGSDILTFSYVGYVPREIPVSFFLNSPCKTLFLTPGKMELTQVIVKEDFNLFAGIKFSTQEPDVTIIRPDKMEGTGGLVSKDVFGSLQRIPGVGSADETATRLNVRGGSPGQNLVLFDDIPLYHYGHIFGNISVFNSNVIEEVRFSKGSVSTSNTGSAASVISIKSKAEIPQNALINLQVSPLLAGITFQSPFAREKAGFYLSARKSIFDKRALNKKLLEQVFQDTRIEDNIEIRDSLGQALFAPPSNSFYDAFAKAVWKPSKRLTLAATGLAVADKMHYSFALCPQEDCFSEFDSLETKNLGYNLGLRYNWQPNFSSVLKSSFSELNKRYHFSEDNDPDSLRSFNYHYNDLEDHSFKLSNLWRRNDIWIDFGYQWQKIALELKNYSTHLFTSDTLEDNSTSITHSFFADYHQDIGDKFNLFFGTRFLTNSLLAQKWYFEPRVAMISKPTKDLAIKLSGSVVNQMTNRLVLPGSLFGNDAIWVLAKDTGGAGDDSIFSVQKSVQLSAGLAYKHPKWQATLDFYTKSVSGVSSYLVDFHDFRPGNTGTLDAEGVELGFQLWQENFFSSLSYSIGKALYRFGTPQDPIIAPYHQRHRLVLMQGAKYKHFDATVTWTFKSGLPYSELDAIEKEHLPNGMYDYHLKFSSINTKRQPPYSRVDFSLAYAKNWPWGKGHIRLSVLNVFGRVNRLFRTYELFVTPQAREGQADPVLLIKDRKGLPLTPNLTLSFEMGIGKKNAPPKEN